MYQFEVYISKKGKLSRQDIIDEEKEQIEGIYNQLLAENFSKRIRSLENIDKKDFIFISTWEKENNEIWKSINGEWIEYSEEIADEITRLLSN